MVHSEDHIRVAVGDPLDLNRVGIAYIRPHKDAVGQRDDQAQFLALVIDGGEALIVGVEAKIPGSMETPLKPNSLAVRSISRTAAGISERSMPAKPSSLLGYFATSSAISSLGTYPSVGVWIPWITASGRCQLFHLLEVEIHIAGAGRFHLAACSC